MKILLPYGETGFSLDVPDENLLGVLKPKGVKTEKSPEELILDALKNPDGIATLSEIIAKKSGAKTAAIAVDDHTRPCPTHLMLPPLIAELCDAGIKEENILIIFATGSHRATKDEEAEKLLGPEIARRIKYISNDCWGDDFVSIGTTSRGTDVKLKKAFYDADVRILTGDVEIHYFAGFGGGRKSILPGVCSYSTIQDNYKRNFFDPNARPAKLDGNPMYENMTEAARFAGVDFTINVVQDAEGVVGAFAGDFDSVLKRGAKLVEDIYKATSPRPADIVVTAANGSPHDIDLYQAYKALHLGLEVVCEGGVVIRVAECREGAGNGVGHKNYAEWMRKYSTKEEMQKELEKEFCIGGHKAYYNHKALDRATLFLVSSMPKQEVEDVFLFRHADNPQEALEKAFEILGKEAKVVVMPEGSTTVSSLSEG